MGLKDLVHQLVDTTPLAKLLELLHGKLSGQLDGGALRVSGDSTGRKLILKGWLLPAKKVAVRYSANWDNPEKGVIEYQPLGAGGWQKTVDGRAVAKIAASKLTLKLTFKDLAGVAHTAYFYAALS